MAMSELDAAAKALKEIQKQMRAKAGTAGFLSEDDVAEWITETRRKENEKDMAKQADEDDALLAEAARRLAEGSGTNAALNEVMNELSIREEDLAGAADPAIE